MDNAGTIGGQNQYLGNLRADYLQQPRATRVLILIVIVASAWNFAFDSTRWALAHRHMDLDGYLVAASVLRHGGNPYDYPQIEAATKSLGADQPLPMTSPLALPMFLAPLTAFSLTLAGHIWGVFITACYVLAVALLLRTYCNTAMACATAIFLAAACSGYVLSLSLGQISPFILLLIVLAAILGEAGHLKSAAAIIALASILKIYPVALLGAFLWRDRKALAVGLAITIVGLGLPALLVPHHVFADSVHMVASQSGNVSTWGQNQSLAAMWYRLFTKGEFYSGIAHRPEIAKALYLASMLVGGAIWLYVCARRGRQVRFGLLLGYTVLTSLLFASLTWEHYLVHSLLAIVVLLCCDDIQSQLTPALLGITLLAAAVVCMPFDYLRVPLAHGIFTLLISIKTFGIAGLWLVCTWLMAQASLLSPPPVLRAEG